MATPNLKEIEWAISELESEESSFPVYEKLAALYTVRKHMRGEDTDRRGEPMLSAYSQAAAPQQTETVGRLGNSEFLSTVEGKDTVAAWKVMDELMEDLLVVNRRMYDGVMRKLNRI